MDRVSYCDGLLCSDFTKTGHISVQKGIAFEGGEMGNCLRRIFFHLVRYATCSLRKALDTKTYRAFYTLLSVKKSTGKPVLFKVDADCYASAEVMDVFFRIFVIIG